MWYTTPSEDSRLGLHTTGEGVWILSELQVHFAYIFMVTVAESFLRTERTETGGDRLILDPSRFPFPGADEFNNLSPTLPANRILVRATATGDLNGNGVVNDYDTLLFNTFGQSTIPCPSGHHRIFHFPPDFSQ